MSKPVVTIYEPNRRQKMGFFQVWIVMFENILKSRGLIVQLFKRDFFAVYKKSFLGITWIFIAPIISVISWVFMNSAGILKPGDVGIPYPVYVLIGTFAWTIFMGFYSSAAGTLSAGAGFILQVHYPHEALLMKQAAQHLANSVISFAVNVVILLAFGLVPSWKIIFLPILILPLFLLGSGIGLIISVPSVVSSEVQKVCDIVLGLLIWVTPVIYSSKIENELIQQIIRWNPLTYLIGGVRDIITLGKIDNFEGFLYSSLFATLVFLLSWRLFYLSEEKVVEKML